MSTITWLHLSDLHACNPRHGWDARRVTDTLVADLRGLQRDHGLRPDLLFFTGDAAFGQIGGEGEKTVGGQLETFGAFLDAVRGAFDPEISLENVFMVPGNHDVDRSLVGDDQTEWLDVQESLEPVNAVIHKGGIQRRRYMERLGAYRSFLENRGFDHLLDPELDGTTHADPSRLIYSVVRRVDGLRIGIAGFNTAWSCCRNGERGRLWMAGRWQQETLRPGLYGADLFRISAGPWNPAEPWVESRGSLGFTRGRTDTPPGTRGFGPGPRPCARTRTPRAGSLPRFPTTRRFPLSLGRTRVTEGKGIRPAAGGGRALHFLGRNQRWQQA